MAQKDKEHDHIHFGEDIDFVVGVTATALTADQILKLTTSKKHKIGHLAKAGLGATVAGVAFTLMNHEINVNHPHKHHQQRDHPYRPAPLHRRHSLDGDDATYYYSRQRIGPYDRAPILLHDRDRDRDVERGDAVIVAPKPVYDNRHERDRGVVHSDDSDDGYYPPYPDDSRDASPAPRPRRRAHSQPPRHHDHHEQSGFMRFLEDLKDGIVKEVEGSRHRERN
ncbi:hypothetical protein B0T22DRAFT_478340 [Podospora appendiculata]|uniref:Uncharacterized protein n=1 Tax=Podospora appendiculata TaxID=314037 RepID=A0AAE1CIA7_9PEZI|nr:hypothetical protein B0T22DRAFT_478340 [Podospora appendiculata]